MVVCPPARADAAALAIDEATEAAQLAASDLMDAKRPAKNPPTPLHAPCVADAELSKLPETLAPHPAAPDAVGLNTEPLNQPGTGLQAACELEAESL